MKVKLEFEVEFEPKDKNESFETLKDYSEDIEYELRHFIKDHCTYDDLDEIFVNSNIKEI